MFLENNLASKCQIRSKLNRVVEKVKDRDLQRIRGKSKTVDFGPGSRAYGFSNKSATGAVFGANHIGGVRAEKFGDYFELYWAVAIGTQLHKAPAFYDGKINIIGKLFDSFRTVEPMIYTRIGGKPYILRVRSRRFR